MCNTLSHFYLRVDNNFPYYSRNSNILLTVVSNNLRNSSNYYILCLYTLLKQDFLGIETSISYFKNFIIYLINQRKILVKWKNNNTFALEK